MKGYRTLTLNLSGGAIAALEATDMTTVITPEMMGWFALFMAIANTVLRFFTDTKVAESK